MSVTSIVNASVQFSGGVEGPSNVIMPQIINTSSVDLKVTAALTVGFQSFATIVGTLAQSLTNTKGVIIIPASGQTGTITFKGVTGDTGIPISATNASIISWDTYTSTAGLTIATATVTATLIFY
jgi:hypothetical protein